MILFHLFQFKLQLKLLEMRLMDQNHSKQLNQIWFDWNSSSS